MNDKKDKTTCKRGYEKLSEPEQFKIVQEVQNKFIKPSQAAKKYNISRRALYNWIDRYNLRNLEKESVKKSISVMEESDVNNVLYKRIRDLEKALKIANTKSAVLETMIEVAEKELKIRIRKKPGPKQSK